MWFPKKPLSEFDVKTQAEAKLIMKKRREFEMALVRRVARKSDFLRYAAYEMDLERLRRKRVEKISECGSPHANERGALMGYVSSGLQKSDHRGRCRITRL